MKIISKRVTNTNENFFDIQMEKNHNFVLANGIIAHNCGTGVGFSVERQYVEKLPTIAEHFSQSDTTVVVEDSKAGWAKAFKELVSLLVGGQIPRWDISKVRPAGARLKTFGGRASGPRPLEDLFKFTCDTFRRAAGRKLTSIECHDIVCKVAEIVVVGGVRRSALISLSNLTDERMREAKSGAWWEANPQRALANNSVAYKEKPEIGTFMEEWLSLYKSKSGERGIFNREATRKTVERLGERRDASYEFGTNPCLHPDTMVETIHGRMKIKDITEPTMVYSMDKDGKLCIRPASASWISKKNAKTIKVHISSGKVLTCTPDHKIYIENRGWVEAQDIKIGDRVVHLVRNRRGAAYSGVKLSTQQKNEYVMEHRLIYEGYHGEIPSGYDIHHIDEDTYNNSIENLECLTHSDHARLTALNQSNDHMVTGYMENGKYGFISPETSKHGAKVIVPMPEELKSNLHQYATVIAISEGPVTDVYDMTVEETHNFVADFIIVHNCSEIILRDREFCNLTEVVVRADDTEESLKRKVRLAAILGTFQASLTHFPYLSSEWKKNCEEEALLGVSLTGIMDNPLMYGKNKNLKDLLTNLRTIAFDTNKEWAKKIKINAAAAITCVKPSGCGTLDTKIKTSYGDMTFSEIFELCGKNPESLNDGDWVSPPVDIFVYDMNNDVRKITNLYVKGFSPVFEIEDENGNVYKFSSEHKLKTKNGWKRVMELTTDDEILSFDALESVQHIYNDVLNHAGVKNEAESFEKKTS